jgi:uncharacterized protein YkwD
LDDGARLPHECDLRLSRGFGRAVKEIAKSPVLKLQARAHYGFLPPQQDFRLQSAARAHTNLMVLQNTLSHQLPGESVLGKQLELIGAFFYAAGETAAFNHTADAAHESFMHSPLHRRIILDPQYDRSESE